MSKSAVEIEEEIWKALRVCSLSAKGLWCVMRKIIEESNRPGYLRQNGRPMSPLQLAREAGCNAAKASRLLQDLSDAGLILNDDEIRAPHLQRLQEIRIAGAARVQRFREKQQGVTPSKKPSKERVLRNTACNADVTQMKPKMVPPPSSPPSDSPLNNPHLPGEESPDPSASANAAAARRGKRQRVLTDEQAEVSKAFRDWWTFEAYPARNHGVAYEFQDSQDGKAVHKQILNSGYVKWDLQRAKDVSTTYLDAPAHSMSGKDRTLFWLGKQINYWISQTAARLRGVRTYEQPKRNGNGGQHSEFRGARSDIPEFGKTG